MTCWGSDITQGSTRGFSNPGGLDGLAEGTKLLSVITIRAERVMRTMFGKAGRQDASRRSGMRLGGVVDVLCTISATEKLATCA